MQGPDPRDRACANRDSEPVCAELAKGVDRLRIAVAGGYFARNGLTEAYEAVERAADALGVRKRLEVPGAALGRAAAFLITNAESSAFHLDRLRARADDFDSDTRDRFLAGALLPAGWYVQAQRVRRWYHDRVVRLFDDIDVLLAPATPCCAPQIGQRTIMLDGREMLVRPHLGLFTQPISCIGLPVCAVPITLTKSMPIGIQIIAGPWREDLCLRVAASLVSVGVAHAPLPTLS
jgi:aspartyl-tRNA(Asn)/glutamyl-tRNA(Gln) amidotransferase subunit A